MSEQQNNRLSEIENLIRMNSKDPQYAETLLNEYRLEAKKNIQASELFIPSDSVISTIDGGSFVIKECEDGILFHLRGGYDVFVNPRMTSLYKHLVYLLRTRERYDELSDEEKRIFDATYHATFVNLQIPVFMANDEEYFFAVAEQALHYLNKFAEAALNAELKPETPVENAEFENMMEAVKIIEESNKK